MQKKIYVKLKFAHFGIVIIKIVLITVNKEKEHWMYRKQQQINKEGEILRDYKIKREFRQQIHIEGVNKK